MQHVCTHRILCFLAKPDCHSTHCDILENDPPTNVTAEFISATILRVSWNPPSDGDTVTGYILRYTDRATGQREAIRLDGSTLSSDVNCDSENTTVQTQSLNQIPSSEATVEFILRKCIYVFPYQRVGRTFSSYFESISR